MRDWGPGHAPRCCRQTPRGYSQGNLHPPTPAAGGQAAGALVRARGGAPAAGGPQPEQGVPDAVGRARAVPGQRAPGLWRGQLRAARGPQRDGAGAVRHGRAARGRRVPGQVLPRPQDGAHPDALLGQPQGHLRDGRPRDGRLPLLPPRHARPRHRRPAAGPGGRARGRRAPAPRLRAQPHRRRPQPRAVGGHPGGGHAPPPAALLRLCLPGWWWVL